VIKAKLLDFFGHLEQLDRSFGIRAKMGHDPPVAGQPNAPAASQAKPLGPATELSGHTIDRSMRISINDFLAHNGSPVIA
jgi:hypothetical protein